MQLLHQANEKYGVAERYGYGGSWQPGNFTNEKTIFFISPNIEQKSDVVFYIIYTKNQITVQLINAKSVIGTEHGTIVDWSRNTPILLTENQRKITNYIKKAIEAGQIMPDKILLQVMSPNNSAALTPI